MKTNVICFESTIRKLACTIKYSIFN